MDWLLSCAVLYRQCCSCFWQTQLSSTEPSLPKTSYCPVLKLCYARYWGVGILGWSFKQVIHHFSMISRVCWPIHWCLGLRCRFPSTLLVTAVTEDWKLSYKLFICLCSRLSSARARTSNRLQISVWYSILTAASAFSGFGLWNCIISSLPRFPHPK